MLTHLRGEVAEVNLTHVGYSPSRGSARETVCEVNWERSVIRGGVEQTKESDVEAWH